MVEDCLLTGCLNIVGSLSFINVTDSYRLRQQKL